MSAKKRAKKSATAKGGSTRRPKKGAKPKSDASIAAKVTAAGKAAGAVGDGAKKLAKGVAALTAQLIVLWHVIHYAVHDVVSTLPIHFATGLPSGADALPAPDEARSALDTKSKEVAFGLVDRLVDTMLRVRRHEDVDARVLLSDVEAWFKSLPRDARRRAYASILARPDLDPEANPPFLDELTR